MTAVDERPVISSTDMAAGHFKLGRVLLGIISNPTFVQPMGWEQAVWPGRLSLQGQFYDDGASLDVRRAQVAAFAVELGLAVTEKVTGDSVRVRAEGMYEGVDVSVWGLAPREDGGVA